MDVIRRVISKQYCAANTPILIQQLGGSSDYKNLLKNSMTVLVMVSQHAECVRDGLMTYTPGLFDQVLLLHSNAMICSATVHFI